MRTGSEGWELRFCGFDVSCSSLGFSACTFFVTLCGFSLLAMLQSRIHRKSTLRMVSLETEDVIKRAVTWQAYTQIRYLTIILMNVWPPTHCFHLY